MNTHEETYHLIEEYLNHELSGDALLQFESELAQNAELANEVELQQLTREITLEASNHELRTKIKSGVTHFDKQQRQKKHLKYGISAAIIAAAITGYLLFQPTDNTPVKLDNPVQKTIKDTAISPSISKIQHLEKEETQPIQKPVKKSIQPISQPVEKDAKKESVEIVNPTPVVPTIATEIKKPVEITTTKEAPKPIILKEKPTLTFDCSQVKLVALPTTKSACVGEENGAVSFSDKQLSGGTPPYTIKYKNKPSITFKNLYAGYYNFTITDKNNCSTTIEVEVIEELCTKTNHTLNVAFESEVKLYDAEGEMTQLTIFNKNGETIYQSNSVDQVTWNGTNTSGDLQHTGLYYYSIKTESETINGQITILN